MLGALAIMSLKLHLTVTLYTTTPNVCLYFHSATYPLCQLELRCRSLALRALAIRTSKSNLTLTT
jgi:hypothetical protein